MAPLTRVLRRWVQRGDGRLAAPIEYALYLLGWILWPLDWLIRIPHLLADSGPSGGRGVRARGIFLFRGSTPMGGSTEIAAALARVRAVLEEAGALLEPHGVRFEVEGVEALGMPPNVAPPSCGVAALLGSFFPWASSRAGASPQLTVYFVDDLGPLAGCAIPGTDWIVADLRTDGTTVTHELGHLADLWRHHPDPDNVMTDRPGGSHDVLTPFQAMWIRTSRFVRPITPGPRK